MFNGQNQMMIVPRIEGHQIRGAATSGVTDLTNKEKEFNYNPEVMNFDNDKLHRRFKSNQIQSK